MVTVFIDAFVYRSCAHKKATLKIHSLKKNISSETADNTMLWPEASESFPRNLKKVEADLIRRTGLEHWVHFFSPNTRILIECFLKYFSSH